ncbi:hypothetical protein MCHIJ_01770 [Mycolicibacterium chitae]|uniref:Transmembrane protein n=1 Tax=Mycolicibacterium chitae TaxID=1792 RepID=A0A3S4T2Z7_MYCCI|nr:hypothetical protein [Mycolicibacterium chitae]MCV7108508.1 hypothetical protein [Mycolicibacterium chitae]BBZ00740.1 hypothetical protein MCHIJ_01770 [Mycolicibacterium chitae]VEG49588.1 Uncharacterised protein [Mycolicibacterium chitae]
MVGFDDGPVGQSKKALPPAAGGSISGHRALLAVLLFVIGVAVVTGVAVAVMSGQVAVAIAIGLVGAAFFSRVGA